MLVDSTDGIGRNFDGYPLFQFRNVKALFLQVGQKAALGLPVGVRHPVARDGALSR